MQSKISNRKHRPERGEGSKIIFAIAAICVVALAWFAASPVGAQTPSVDDEVNRIAKTLYCPVCPNTPLDVCNTQACADWRKQIKEMLIQGKSEQQIRDYFVQQFGERVLGAPPAEGFNWIAYILPALGIVLGAVVAWLTVRQWILRRADVTSAPEAPAIPKEYADRIEKELKEY
jgi:cytochrome c-type biogenesis protein CcmH